AWYWYADLVYLRTGLTQAVFRPSGTYPADVAPGISFTSVSHWATRERLLSLAFWQTMLDRLWGLYLTPYGFLAALVGISKAFTSARGWAIHLWALAGAALVVMSAEGQYWHEFHTLPLVPPLVLYAGLAAAPLFDGRVLARRLRLPDWRAGVAMAVPLVLVSLQTFRASGVLNHLYRVERAEYLFVIAGPMVRLVTDGTPIVTVDYDDGGANSAMMLYHAHRQGWSFDVHSISPGVIEHLRTTKGAGYFVTSRWRSIRDQKPEVADYLRRFKVVPQPESVTGNLLVFDLRQHSRP
ncbi:MAG: hypothetical protein ACRD1H_07870, partial [Vicinamibacterales bacterium]